MTKKGTFIFTSEENTDSPPGMSEVNKLKSVSYKGKRGFLLQVPIYGKDKKTIVAMPRFSMIWNSTMLLKSVWFSC